MSVGGKSSSIYVACSGIFCFQMRNKKPTQRCWRQWIWTPASVKEVADALCWAQGECDKEQRLIIAQQLSQLLGNQPVPVFQGNVSAAKENWRLRNNKSINGLLEFNPAWGKWYEHDETCLSGMSLKPQYRQNVFLCFPCNACNVCTVKSLIYWCFDLEISEPQACADEYGVMDPNKFEAKANLGCRGAAPHCFFLKHLVCWFTAPLGQETQTQLPMEECQCQPYNFVKLLAPKTDKHTSTSSHFQEENSSVAKMSSGEVAIQLV